jgi:hypothetical protein
MSFHMKPGIIANADRMWNQSARSRFGAPQSCFEDSLSRAWSSTNDNHTPHMLPLDIEDIISIARQAKATDPRDLVYGPLAMFPKELKEAAHVSYDENVTTGDVFSMFTKAFVQTSGHLNILASFSGRRLYDSIYRDKTCLGQHSYSRNCFTNRVSDVGLKFWLRWLGSAFIPRLDEKMAAPCKLRLAEIRYPLFTRQSIHTVQRCRCGQRSVHWTNKSR